MNRREFLTAAGVAGAAPLVHGAASPEPAAAPFQAARYRGSGPRSMDRA